MLSRDGHKNETEQELETRTVDYSEVHHLELLSEGVCQVESNFVIVCPNHHRMFHYANTNIFDLIGDTPRVCINGVDHNLKYK